MANQHALILFDTDDDLFLSSNEDGDPIEIIITDGRLNGYDIFSGIDDNEVVKQLMKVLDPIALKFSRRLNEMLPDFINATNVTLLTIKVNEQPFIVSCIKVKQRIRKYLLPTTTVDLDEDEDVEVPFPERLTQAIISGEAKDDNTDVNIMDGTQHDDNTSRDIE